MRQSILILIGILGFVFGLLFLLQGLGVIRWPASSFMIDSRTWVLRGGFLDGRAGFMIAVFNAETVYYRFLKLARYNGQDERQDR